MAALQSRVSALAFACFLAVPAFAENIVFPTGPTSPVINVKTAFGAAGDGVTDDTAADSFRIASLTATGGAATLAFTALAPTPASGTPPTVTVTNPPNSRLLLRPVPGPAQVEVSTDLASWSNDTVTTQILGTNAAWQLLPSTEPAPTTNTPRRFFRTKTTTP